VTKHRSIPKYFRAMAGVGCAVLIFIAGAYVARAGSPSAPTSTLAYDGVLLKNDQPLTGPQSLVFAFKKGAVVVCQSPSLPVTPDSSGRFQVQIPMDSCPTSLFDGSAVSVDISVGSDIAAQDVPVTPVPYAFHAEQLGTAECPSGYDHDSVASSAANVVACVHGNDHVVRVGTGATAFWIDRYEASLWSDSAATAQQYGAGVDYPSGFPATGQGALDTGLYAVSKSGVLPSVSMTWFQASRACRASGKRLPSNEEWTEAATGTPRGTDDLSGPCSASLGVYTLRPTGQGLKCVSLWGAEDMVGNAAEVTSEWAMGVGTQQGFTPIFSWPSDFGGEMWNVTSTSYDGATGPMEVARGAAAGNGVNATVFSIAVTQTVAQPTYGFRCMIPR
jgi:formylglycine-generating enzyme required for sulfatase activity